MKKKNNVLTWVLKPALDLKKVQAWGPWSTANIGSRPEVCGAIPWMSELTTPWTITPTLSSNGSAPSMGFSCKVWSGSLPTGKETSCLPETLCHCCVKIHHGRCCLQLVRIAVAYFRAETPELCYWWKEVTMVHSSWHVFPAMHVYQSKIWEMKCQG